MAGLLALACMVSGIAGVRFHHGLPYDFDEEYWIGSSYYFGLMASGQWEHAHWQLLPARENPPVGKYAFGLVLSLEGHPVRSLDLLAHWYGVYRDVPGAWGQPEDALKRQAVVDQGSMGLERNVPQDTREQLSLGRGLAVVMGIVSVLSMAWIGRAVAGPGTGLLAGGLFAMHPLAIDAYTHAMVDVIALTFSLLAMLWIVLWVREGRAGTGTNDVTRRGWPFVLLVGFTLALACGAKMNALVVVMTMTAVMLFFFLRAWGEKKDFQQPILMGAAIFLGGAFFIALNPTLYPDPMEGLRALLAEPFRTTQIQAHFIGGFLPTIAERAKAVGTLLAGRPFVFIFALLLMIWPAREGFRRFGALSVVLLWWMLGMIAVVGWIPFAWPRYALPVLPPMIILLAWTCSALTKEIQARFNYGA